MNGADGYCVVLTTCADMKQAGELASGLIEKRLAACVQITPVTSYYEWKGKVNRDSEQLLLIKAKAGSYTGIEEFIRATHTYEVPEIVRIPIESGLSSYLKWIDKVSG